MIVRKMESSDLDRVVEIAGSLQSAPRWPREVYESAMKQGSAPRRIALVAEKAGVGVVGFAVAAFVMDEASIETIGVLVRWQRKGIGRGLLAEIERELVGQGVRRIVLEVRESNAAAQTLYRLHGFAEVGRRLSYYIDPKEDAVLMAVGLRDA